MKRLSSIGIVAAALATLAGPASAGDGMGHRFGRHGPPPIDRILERHAEDLELSDEVRAKVHDIAAAAEEQAKPLREALDAAREAMHALLAQDDPDPDAVVRQAEVVGAAETEMHKQRLRTLLAVRELLTPEQRRGLVKIFEERRKRMKEWGSEGGSPPDAPKD